MSKNNDTSWDLHPSDRKKMRERSLNNNHGAVYGKSGKVYAGAVSDKSTSELFRMGYSSAEVDDIRRAKTQGKKSGLIFIILVILLVAVCIYQFSKSNEDYATEFIPRVLELTNAERANFGLAPLLAGGDALQQAASIRAKELDSVFSHDRPDGTRCFTVLAEVGVYNYSISAENIASGQRSPEEVVHSWMNSEGHKANILNPNLRYLSVGYTNGNWVQLFLG